MSVIGARSRIRWSTRRRSLRNRSQTRTFFPTAIRKNSRGMNEPRSRYDRAALGADNLGDLGVGQEGGGGEEAARCENGDRPHRRGKQPQRETDAKEMSLMSSSKGRSLLARSRLTRGWRAIDARLTRVLECATASRSSRTRVRSSDRVF